MIDAKAFSELSKLVMLQAMTLDERLACLLKLHESKIVSKLQVKEIHNYNGLSGYNFWDGDTLIAQLYLGTLLSGTHVIYKKTYFNGELNEVYDYYDHIGQYFYTSSTMDGQCLQYSQQIMMDTTSPYINHLYNVLHHEYNQTIITLGNTDKISFIEGLLQKFYKSKEFIIDANHFTKDNAKNSIKFL